MLSAAKWGALIGAALYLIAGLALPLIARALLPTTDLSNPAVVTIGCVGIFLVLFGFSAAGYFTGRETMRAGLGAIAGVIAMVVYTLLTGLYAPASGTATTANSQSKVSPVGQAAASIIALALVLGLAALMGWLGGRPGAQQARRAKAAQIGVESADQKDSSPA